MRTHMRTYMVVPVIILISGCYDNALYYYDKENVALNIEGRPDPSAPVQISIGLKQRTAFIAPGTCSKAEGNDAVSLLSFFRARKDHDGDQFGKITISASFATGEGAPFVAGSANPCASKLPTSDQTSSVGGKDGKDAMGLAKSLAPEN